MRSNRKYSGTVGTGSATGTTVSTLQESFPSLRRWAGAPGYGGPGDCVHAGPAPHLLRARPGPPSGLTPTITSLYGLGPHLTPDT